MANIRAHIAWPAQADLRIHVGAVHVNLPAIRMNKLADFFDGFFKNPMSRWVCDHQRRQVVAIGLRFSSQILEVHVALPIASAWHHFHAGHDGAGWIGSVSRLRNQNDLTMAFAAAGEKLLYYQVVRVFSL